MTGTVSGFAEYGAFVDVVFHGTTSGVLRMPSGDNSGMLRRRNDEHSAVSLDIMQRLTIGQEVKVGAASFE